MNRNILIGLVCLLPATVLAEQPKAPATVKKLFADFDPRKDEHENNGTLLGSKSW